MEDMLNNIYFIMQGRMKLENNEKSRKQKIFKEKSRIPEKIKKIERLMPLRKKHIRINILNRVSTRS